MVPGKAEAKCGSGDFSLVRPICFYVVIGLPFAGLVLSMSMVLVSLQFLLRIEGLLANLTGLLTLRILAHCGLLSWLI
jgi:hypothetical protein